jgi:hypothetical protein
MSLRPFRKPAYILCLLAAFDVPCAFADTQKGSDKPFKSMAVTPDEPGLCLVPRPPADLAPTAYVRNGYRAILRIMAAEMWQKTDLCDCFLAQIQWADVVERSEEFKASNDPRRPFDVSALRQHADALFTLRDETCAE